MGIHRFAFLPDDIPTDCSALGGTRRQRVFLEAVM